MASASAPVLAYENLGLIQGSGWLFRGLDLFIGARDRLALIGRNGAGKTTLLKCLAGHDRHRRGAADDPAGHPGRAAGAGPGRVALRHACAISRWRAARRRTRSRRSPTRSASTSTDPRRRHRAASGGARRSPARWRRIRTCCCSTSRPIISISPRSSGWRTWLSRYTGAFIAISHDRTFLKRLTALDACGSTADRCGARRSASAASRPGPSRSMPRKRATPSGSTPSCKLEEHWLQRGVTARRTRNQGRLGQADGDARAARGDARAAGHRQARARSE